MKVNLTPRQVIELAQHSKTTNPSAGIDICCEFIEAMTPHIRPWINSIDEKPEDHQIVIIDGGAAKYRKGTWWKYTQDHGTMPMQNEPKRWMPLPN